MSITAKYKAKSYNYSELEIGKEYEVEDIEVGQSYSYVLLIGKGKAYNTVAFDFFEDGKPLDFLKDFRFNSYLGRQK